MGKKNCRYCGIVLPEKGKNKYCSAKHREASNNFKRDFITEHSNEFSDIKQLHASENYTFDFLNQKWKAGFDNEIDDLLKNDTQIDETLRQEAAQKALNNIASDIYFYDRDKIYNRPASTEAVNINIQSDQEVLSAYPVLTPSVAAKIAQQVDQFLLSGSKIITPEMKYTLERYEGKGNVFDTGKQPDSGILHQFYTPYILCKKMMELAMHHGFSSGTILEPSCGTGRFFKFAPNGSKLIGFDTEKTNTEIASLLYPQATIYTKGFETAFLNNPYFTSRAKKSWIEPVDLVIGNPPYGEYSGYYKSYMPKIYSRFEFLFIRLGLELLKPGGILVFLISNNLMNNGSKYNGMKKNILEIGEFVDAFRMPNKIFTGTSVGTDIVVFRKK